MQSFSVIEGRPEDFVVRVEKELHERNFNDIAAIRLEGDALIVTFSWIGTTSLTYRVRRDDRGGFSANLEQQKISPFHAPFKAGFVERFDQILDKVGAISS